MTDTPPHNPTPLAIEQGGRRDLQGVRVSFAFDTPGLLEGIPIYVPAIDEILIACWVSVEVAFNGAFPAVSLHSSDGGTPFEILCVRLDRANQASDGPGEIQGFAPCRELDFRGGIFTKDAPLVLTLTNPLNTDPGSTCGRAELGLLLQQPTGKRASPYFNQAIV